MAAPVRIEVETHRLAQPQHQVINRGIGPRVPERAAPEIDEDVVGIQITVLTMQIVGIQPDQLRTNYFDLKNPRLC